MSDRLASLHIYVALCVIYFCVYINIMMIVICIDDDGECLDFDMFKLYNLIKKTKRKQKYVPLGIINFSVYNNMIVICIDDEECLDFDSFSQWQEKKKQIAKHNISLIQSTEQIFYCVWTGIYVAILDVIIADFGGEQK